MNSAWIPLYFAAWLVGADGDGESYLGLKMESSQFFEEDEFDGGEQGLTVASVVENSPAQQAGIQAGDVVLSLDGVRPRSVRHLESYGAALPIGTRAKLEILRGQRILTVDVTTVRRLTSRPAPEARSFVETRRLGVVVDELTAQEATRYGVAVGDGVRLRRFLRGSEIADSGLSVDDILLAFDDKTIHGGEDFLAVVNELEPGVKITVQVASEQERREVVLRTRDPSSHVSQFTFPFIVDYRHDRNQDETRFGLLPLNMIKYERKENESTYCFLWFICLTLGTNEVLEDLDA